MFVLSVGFFRLIDCHIVDFIVSIFVRPRILVYTFIFYFSLTLISWTSGRYIMHGRRCKASCTLPFKIFVLTPVGGLCCVCFIACLMFAL